MGDTKILWKSCDKQWQSYRSVYFYWIENHMEWNVSLCGSEATWKVGSRGGTCPIAGDTNICIFCCTCFLSMFTASRCQGYQTLSFRAQSLDLVACNVQNNPFLQRVSIACYAERCISYDRFCPTVWPSDRLSHAGIMPKRLQLRSWGLHWRIGGPITLVSWRLTSARNSEGNMRNEAPNERGVAKM